MPTGEGINAEALAELRAKKQRNPIKKDADPISEEPKKTQMVSEINPSQTQFLGIGRLSGARCSGCTPS
jgi:predicted  nucleic acid-binding Zn-ribbon protein